MGTSKRGRALMTQLKTVKTPTGSNSLPPQGAFETLKDAMGRFRTKSLFVEHKHPDYSAPYTLKPYDHKGSMSMYRKYMEIGDPTEYEQAIALLGSWKHWKLLSEATWFKPLLTEWRRELKVKFESDRYHEMLDVAENSKGTPMGVQATKWLAERYSQQTPKRGRPSKAEKKAALKQEQDEDTLLKEEIERLGL